MPRSEPCSTHGALARMTDPDDPLAQITSARAFVAARQPHDLERFWLERLWLERFWNDWLAGDLRSWPDCIGFVDAT
jgi:hypothetical protein